MIVRMELGLTFRTNGSRRRPAQVCGPTPGPPRHGGLSVASNLGTFGDIGHAWRLKIANSVPETKKRTQRFACTRLWAGTSPGAPNGASWLNSAADH
jgi:hypothetical protein